MAYQSHASKDYWLRYTNAAGREVLSTASNPTHLKQLFEKAVKAGHTNIIGYYGNASERREMYIGG